MISFNFKGPKRGLHDEIHEHHLGLQKGEGYGCVETSTTSWTCFGRILLLNHKFRCAHTKYGRIKGELVTHLQLSVYLNEYKIYKKSQFRITYVVIYIAVWRN